MNETRSSDVASASEVATSSIRVQATVATKLNLADFQNAVPMLREVSIVNDTASEIKALELRVTSVPPFLKTKIWRIDAIESAKFYRIPDLDVQLDGALLTRLTEAETATVSFTLRSVGDAPEEIARLDSTVELLPRNQWGGLSHLPDMLAAFVQPNESVIERLLKQAAVFGLAAILLFAGLAAGADHVLGSSGGGER